jgi:hypothetical protein
MAPSVYIFSPEKAQRKLNQNMVSDIRMFL